VILLRSHITQSKNEVRKITLHMLHEARNAMQRPSGTSNRRRKAS